MRLPLVFSTHNDDVVKASCSVIREQKREERHIQNALVSLSTHKKEKKATKKVDVAVSTVVESLSCVPCSSKKNFVKTQFFPKTVFRFHVFRV